MTEELDIAVLGQLTRDLVGSEVSVGYSEPQRGKEADLMAPERTSIAGMVPKRLREFAAGRAAVRMAALAHGDQPFPLPMGADRAPQWPDGVIGSIAHTDKACLAIVSRGKSLASIGIDLEHERSLPPAVADAISCRADRCKGHTAQQELGDRYDSVLFSAKEAAYKCQYPLSGTLIGFDAMSIRLSPEDGTFVAQFEQSVGAFDAGMTFNGRFAFCGGHVVTTAWITSAEWLAISEHGSGIAYG
ncbi:hypothetical protein GCM10007385_15860 [Tateyamaria omphalii]|uniref:4'-phosphopantetheinyl transferase family protein n=1 Tax=Tateyamaria omphalii TaxID=299262 RepID=UPI001679BA6A|nr:4'-phosphopantetheinyl transferase superfamily protein [Tateyamaria omphalii]GGX48662.1 hypothetical protein GCM10007385_15860 [Tateyamaria omphalii]